MATEIQKSQEYLRSAKDYTDNIIKSMLDTLIVMNPDGTIRTVNHAMLNLLDYKEKELIGKPIGTILVEEEEEEEEEDIFRGTPLHQLIKRGSVEGLDITFRAKMGEKIPMSLSGSVMRDVGGDIVGIVCVAKDLRPIQAMMRREKELTIKAKGAEVMERERAKKLNDAYTELTATTEQLERFNKGKIKKRD